jgi:hypothetical protein
MFRWKSSLNGLNSGDRLRILEAEQKAKHMAIEFNCAERCVEHPIGIADCTDISIYHTKTRWMRRGGRILVHIMVWLNPDARLFEAKWKLPQAKPQPQGKEKRFPKG